LVFDQVYHKAPRFIIQFMVVITQFVQKINKILIS